MGPLIAKSPVFIVVSEPPAALGGIIVHVCDSFMHEAVKEMPTLEFSTCWEKFGRFTPV